jgi:hypothetical protein
MVIKPAKVVQAAWQERTVSPKHDVDAQIFGNWHPSDDPVGWVLDNQHCNVNTGCKPSVLIRKYQSA